MYVKPNFHLRTTKNFYETVNSFFNTLFLLYCDEYTN